MYAARMYMYFCGCSAFVSFVVLMDGGLVISDARLREVDEAYICALDPSRGGSTSNSYSIEERMLKYQRECDQRMRQMVEAQIAHFKETEISNMRVEEANKFRKQLSDMRRCVYFPPPLSR